MASRGAAPGRRGAAGGRGRAAAGRALRQDRTLAVGF